MSSLPQGSGSLGGANHHGMGCGLQEGRDLRKRGAGAAATGNGGLKPMEKTGKGLNHGFLGPCLQNLGCRKGIHIGNCFCKYTIHEGQVGSKPCKDGWLDLTETIPALCVYSSKRLATDNED